MKIQRVIEIEESDYKYICDIVKDITNRKGQPPIDLDVIAQSKPYDDSGDCISRSALISEIGRTDEWYKGCSICNIIDNAPTVEPERQVEKINKIPKDFVYDTETPEFYCYRNKYTGKEIHVLKEPKTYTLERPQGEWKHIGGDEWVCSECGHVITTEGSWEHPLSTGAYHCENCGADMRKGGAE